VLQFVPEVVGVGGEVVLATGVHLEVVFQCLEKFGWLGDPSRLDLGPEGKAVDGNLEGAGRDELRLDGVRDEEEHHAGVQLVVERPSERRWRRVAPILAVQVDEGVERRQDANN